MELIIRHVGVAVVTIFGAVWLLLTPTPVCAEPSKAQVINLWEVQHRLQGRVLDVKSRGGQRSTNELDSKHYLNPVGTCWDYDVIELQKCGCRLFEKASVCCRTGSNKECEVRIGTSTKFVTCSTYGKPKFGLSGDQEPAECKEKRTSADCWNRKDLVFGAGSTIGPCTGSGGAAQDWPPAFTCPKGYDTVNDFHAKKCGPTPEDCGCVLVEECSNEAGLACYREWKKGITAQSASSAPEATKTNQQGTQSPQAPAESTINKMKSIIKKPF